MDDFQVAVILPAAGLGTRFGGRPGTSKIEIDLAGRPVFLRAIEVFQRRKDVRQVLLAVNPDRKSEFEFRWGDRLSLLGVTVVPGGRKERWETVLEALHAVDELCTHVAVHDAARPLATTALIDRVFEAARRFHAVIPAMPAANTLKRVHDVAEDAPADPLDGILGPDTGPAMKQVVETVDRRGIVEVQTPQVFSLPLIRQAYEQIRSGQLDASGITDDASLVEAMGQPVFVVEGESTNLKITRPADAELATALVEKREAASAKDFAAKRLFADDED